MDAFEELLATYDLTIMEQVLEKLWDESQFAITFVAEEVPQENV